MGKYDDGSWGASSARSAFQRLNEVGKFGGSLDSEKTLLAWVMVEMAAVRSMGSRVIAETSFFSSWPSAAGAATLCD